MKIKGMSKLAKLLTNFYQDELDVFRVVNSIQADGSTKGTTTPTLVLEKIKCRAEIKSNDTQDTHNKTPSISPLVFTGRLFLHPTVAIKAGDTVQIRAKNVNGLIIKTYKGTVGDPVIYDTHQETLLTVTEVC